MKKIENISKDKIVYIDETEIDAYLYCEYGYSLRGKKVYRKISGRKYKRVGIVATQLNKKMIAPLEYSGIMKSDLFEYWFSKQLMPILPKDSVIVMHNASFHRKKQLFSIFYCSEI